MRRVHRSRRIVSAPAMVAGVLALTLFSAGALEAQLRGLESNVLILERASQRGCKGCRPDDPKVLITQASAAIRMDQEEGGDLLSIQVIPLLAKELSISRIAVDGVEAKFDQGLWQVKRSAKTRKKAPKIEITCEDGQELRFKPQHLPRQGPVGGLIMPKSEERPQAELSFHKKSFWADSLG